MQGPRYGGSFALATLAILIGSSSPARAEVAFTADAGKGTLTSLAWDTDGAPKAGANLLRAGTAVGAQARHADQPLPAPELRVTATKTPDGGFDVAVAGAPPAGSDHVSVLFPFDPRASAVTVLPARIDAAGLFHLPAVVSAPGFGQILATGPEGADVTCVLEGSRANKTVDWRVDLPVRPGDTGAPSLHFKPVLLPPPEGLADDARWALVRRAWFYPLSVTARWGDAGKPFSAPSGVLGNNVVSDPVSCCLFIYADEALWTPNVAEGVSAMNLVRYTLDWWLEKRMFPTGEVPGYWDLRDFLDSNPSLLISAWDYVEAAGDVEWLKARVPLLERCADYSASRDVDGDGFVEAVQTGNPNQLRQPARSCSAYDAVNCGWKDGYSNALIYRGWRCLAELETKLGRADAAAKYTHLADRLKAVFAKTLYNPQTGMLGWYRSKDGVLHDFGSPFVNGLAIEYGLVEPEQGRQILARLADEMARVGFKRFDLGVPITLHPVPKADYIQGVNCCGEPKRDDGSDTFGLYLNGGVATGDALRYMAALYTVGEQKQADQILDAMLARLAKGDFPDGFPTRIVDAYPAGAEFLTWDGKPCGYEGFLSHAYHFVQAVALRDPKLRARIHRPLGTP